MAYDSKWWGMRSGDLVGSNTITQDISDSIKKFFSKKDGKAGDIFLVILALIAFHFGIEGYKMIVGKFMGDMPSAVRIIVDLIPMGVGGYLFYLAFFNKFDSKVYMESSAALCIILMGMSLQSLGMEIGMFDGSKWMVYLMLFSIPVIYLATSTVGAVLYLGTLFTWLGGLAFMGGIGESIGGAIVSAFMGGGGGGSMLGGASPYNSGEAIFGWFFLLLILPHFMRYTDRPSYDTRKLYLGWVGGILMIITAFSCFTSYGIIAFPFLIACFYMAGKEYYADGKFWWNRPFQTLSIVIFVAMAWSLCNLGGNGDLLGMSGIAEGAEAPNAWYVQIVNALIVLGVIAWGAYSIYNDYKGEKKANIMLMAFPIVMILILLIDRVTASDSFTAGMWLASLYVIALGADYVMKGIKEKNYQLLALGVVIALPILVDRIKELLKDVLSEENGAIIEGLLLIGISTGLLYLGMTLYKSTRPSED